MAFAALDPYPVGFVGAVGRRTNAGDIYLSSFLAVRPGSLGSLAMMLVRKEGRTIATKIPVLVFAETGSLGEQMLAAFDSVGRRRNSLGKYRLHAAAPRRMPDSVRVRELPPQAWADAADAIPSSPHVLRQSFDHHTVAHFASHGCRFVAAFEGDRVLGTALLRETRIREADGSCRSFPSLSYVRLADQRADSLSGLLFYPGQPFVSVPNTTNIHPSTARAAGLRGMPTEFGAWLYDSDGFTSTEMEIV